MALFVWEKVNSMVSDWPRRKGPIHAHSNQVTLFFIRQPGQHRLFFLFLSFFLSSLSMTSYASSFPVLHSIPLPPFMNLKRSQDAPPVPPHADPLTPPKCPSYLKQTAYTDLVHQQYDQAMRRKRSAHETDELLTLDLRLPTAWNPSDKAKHITVDSQCLALKYAGKSRGGGEGSMLLWSWWLRNRSGENRGPCSIGTHQLPYAAADWAFLLRSQDPKQRRRWVYWDWILYQGKRSWTLTW